MEVKEEIKQEVEEEEEEEVLLDQVVEVVPCSGKASSQCCGSMTFWSGSGSGSADPCL